MKLIVCVDDHNGMMFNGRRQSQDRLLRQNLMDYIGGHKLFLAPYSAKLFQNEYGDRLVVDENFLPRVGAEDYCFVEDRDCGALAGAVEELILYRWNRSYPADVRFRLDPKALGLHSSETTEFVGSSHEKITREVFKR